MANNRLNIVTVTNSNEASASTSKINRREEARAKFEKMWLKDPKQFNPMRNAMQRERIDRTFQLINSFLDLKNKKVTDLGCGSGVLASRLAEKGAHVDAVDVASNALKLIKEKNIPNITTIQDYVPNTKLNDDSYDLVVSTNLIAYLQQDQFRLYFSELARLVKKEGFVVCSTSLDIYSDDALHRFITLSETELKIEKWIFSYHALYIRIHSFLSAPGRFYRAHRDPECRKQELNKRHGFSKHWFVFNSSTLPAYFWSGFSYILSPLLKAFEQSRFMLLNLEKICRFVSSDAGISHAICLGIRRSLVEHTPENEIPIERKHKRQVWE